MDARYLQAVSVLPNQTKVCGRTLRPVCLRHRIALEAIGSPFGTESADKPVTPLDVVLAARILSTYDKEKMTGKLSISEKWHLVRMTLSRKYFSRMIGRLLGCFKVSLSYPKVWEKESEKENRRYERIPFPLACVSNLVRNGCTLEEAWTMPEGEAAWMAVAHAIYNGSKIEVLSTDEEKELEKFDERIAAYKKANNLS